MQRCLVIGGGVTGLTAGVYAAANGYETTILERHTEPGGVCAAWERGPYTYDLCLHWLLGTRLGDRMRTLYEEIGALDQVELYPITTLTRLVDEPTGTELVVTPDLQRLVDDVARRSPADAAHVQALVDAARTVADVDLAPGELESVAQAVERGWSLRPVPLLFARLPMTASEWARRLQDPGIRSAFGALTEGEAPAALLALQLGQLAGGHLSGVRSRAGFRTGGSRAFADGIVARFAAQGGTLRLGAEVAEILVENHRAVGVRLADGEELRADHIISTAPLHTTVWRLLGGRYMTRELEHRFARWKVFPPLAVVHAGCARTWETPGGSVALRETRPIDVFGRACQDLAVRTFDADPQLGPAGHTVFQAQVRADYDAWAELHHTPAAYHAAKRRLGEQVLQAMEGRWPGISAAATHVDVATPYTFWRYTRAWRGSYEGWWPSGEAMSARFDRRLPGLGGLVLAGQWLSAGGGVPPAVAQGRDAVRALCTEDARPFRAPGVAAGPPAAVDLPPVPLAPAVGWRDVGEAFVGAVAMAACLLTPALRERRDHWGMTPAEAARPRVGDDLVPQPSWSWTHGIDVSVPARVVWPWLVQLGQERGGFYSYVGLENLMGSGIHNADRLLPDAQSVRVGDTFRLSAEGPAMRVSRVDPGEALVVAARIDLDAGRAVPDGDPLPPRGAAASWAFVVEPTGETSCRVVSRFRVQHPPDLRARVAFGSALLEPIGFVMDRRMLLGIRERAEGSWSPPLEARDPR